MYFGMVGRGASLVGSTGNESELAEADCGIDVSSCKPEAASFADGLNLNELVKSASSLVGSAMGLNATEFVGSATLAAEEGLSFAGMERAALGLVRGGAIGNVGLAAYELSQLDIDSPQAKRPVEAQATNALVDPLNVWLPAVAGLAVSAAPTIAAFTKHPDKDGTSDSVATPTVTDASDDEDKNQCLEKIRAAGGADWQNPVMYRMDELGYSFASLMTAEVPIENGAKLSYSKSAHRIDGEANSLVTYADSQSINSVHPKLLANINDAIGNVATLRSWDVQTVPTPVRAGVYDHLQCAPAMLIPEAYSVSLTALDDHSASTSLARQNSRVLNQQTLDDVGIIKQKFLEGPHLIPQHLDVYVTPQGNAMVAPSDELSFTKPLSKRDDATNALNRMTGHVWQNIRANGRQ